MRRRAARADGTARQARSTIRPTGRVPTLAAASSIASGSPSRCRQSEGDVARRRFGELELRQYLSRAILEQADRVRRDDLARIVGSFLGHRERRHDPPCLPTESERLPTRRQQVELRTRRDRRLHEPPHAVQDVLAVVEDQRHVPVAERLDRPFGLVGGPSTATRVRLEHARHGRRDLVGIRRRREVDEPASVAELARAGQADLDREARLPRPAGSDQRDESLLADRSPDVGEEVVPPDEPGERRGEVPDDRDAGRGGDECRRARATAAAR